MNGARAAGEVEPGAVAGRLATVQRCEACGTDYEERAAIASCARCGGLLELRPAPPLLRGAALRSLFDERVGGVGTGPSGVAASGVWRFRELVLPGLTAAEIVTQPEGGTPLLERATVARWAGAEGLLLKHDGFNPTGSFKDRGMTAAVTQARRIGATAVACASTGNTSASLAAYAALAGIPALVLVPADAAGVPQVSLGKLAQTLAYGARTLLVRGDFDACLRLARESADRLGVYLVNSINPFRLAGQQSCVFEVLQQLRWTPPDWIVLPAGNLGNTSAFGAAIRAALAAGLIDRAPRIASVQAAGAAPFARSFREGFGERYSVRADTVATAIKIGDPASHDRAVRAIRATNGVVLDVSDAEILEAKAVIDASGVGCEPASAASVAGVRQLVRDELIRPGDRVVAVLTGHVLKDPGILLDYHRAGDARSAPRPHANPPIEVDGTLAAIEHVLAAAARDRA